jgi:hypothetical protein
MSQPQKCIACQHVGYDVGPRLVRVEPTETERFHGHVVPVGYQVQVRCVDKRECEDRVFSRREPG